MQIKPYQRFFIGVTILFMALSLIFQGSTGRDINPPLLNVESASAGGGLVLPQTHVAVVQSSKAEASQIDVSGIEAMVREAVALAGGFEDLIDDGDVVILKPNLIAPYDMTYTPQNLPPNVNGITTDWRVAQAVVNLVRERNPNGSVYILEGVAEQNTDYNMNLLQYTPAHIEGVDDFIHLENQSGGWKEYTSPLLAEVTLPNGVGLYPDYKKPNRSAEFYMNKIYYEAEVVISLPVLKNHSQSNITGAVKNVGIGASPTNIYGGVQGDNHRFVNSTIDHTPYYLHRWIHDYFLCRPVDFVIMDGLQGSSDGPVGMGGANLAAVQENMRLILAGKDAVSVDAIASLIMGYDPSKITHLTLLHNSLAGCADPIFIRVEGALLTDLKKRFNNANNVDIYAYYSDFTPPVFTINSVQEEGDDLLIGLTSDTEIVKVEVAIDGVRLDPFAVDDFGELQFDISDLPDGNHQITIYAYDKYLNCATQEVNVTTDVTDPVQILPDEFQLMQNYPNPFNPVTRIVYSLGKHSNVMLTVHNLSGQIVTTLVDDVQSPGLKSVIWNGEDNAGRSVSGGTYLCRLQTESDTRCIKLLYIK